VRPETTVKINNRTPAVQNLLMNGAFPVYRATAKIYFASDVGQNAAAAHCARAFVNRFACLRPRNT
jgi:hypothetical protein